MARRGKVTCPNCGWKIEVLTLHRVKVTGSAAPRKRKDRMTPDADVP